MIDRIADLLRTAGAERKQTSQADAERALQETLAAARHRPAGWHWHLASAFRRKHWQDASATQRPPAPLPPVDCFAGLEDGQCIAKYLSIFIDEAGIRWMNLPRRSWHEQGAGGNVVETLLIVSHRIKGSAASIGLHRAAKLAHLIEDQLQHIRDAGGALSAKLVDAMLACVDGLRHYVDSLKRGKPETSPFPGLARGLLAAGAAPAENATGANPGPSAAASPTEAIPAAPREAKQSAARLGLSRELHAQVAAAAADHEGVFVGQVVFAADLPLVGLKARLIYEKLCQAGDVCFFAPPPEQLDSIEGLRQVAFGLAARTSPAALGKQLQIAGVESATFEPLAAAAGSGTALSDKPAPPAPAKTAEAAAAAPAETAAATDASRPTETLRVDIERLDQLMNLAGQLVINKARFAHIAERLKGALGSRRSLQSLARVFSALEKMTGERETEEAAHAPAEIATLRQQARGIRHELDSVRCDIESLEQVRGSLNDLFESVHQLDRVSDGIQRSVMEHAAWCRSGRCSIASSGSSATSPTATARASAW